jgi:hypothetical protein
MYIKCIHKYSYTAVPAAEDKMVVATLFLADLRAGG